MTLTCCQDHILTENIWLVHGLKHHIVEMRGGVMDAGQPTDQTITEDNGIWRLSFANLILLSMCILTEDMSRHDKCKKGMQEVGPRGA